jgi:hypothetical protein
MARTAIISVDSHVEASRPIEAGAEMGTLSARSVHTPEPSEHEEPATERGGSNDSSARHLYQTAI